MREELRSGGSTDLRAGDKISVRLRKTLVKDLLVPHWRQTVASRAGTKVAIEDALDQGLPAAYTAEMYRQKCDALFEHIYESYPDGHRVLAAEVA
ncbi:MAG: hypothetical protein ACKO1V_01725 [Cyanobium sp.]